MMRVDAWTHFIPKPFADRMAQIAGNFADIGKRMREIPCIHDLDERRRVVDQFPDYAQILSYAMPPIENIVQGEQTEELCKLINDGFVDICAKHKDHFPGWVAQVSLAYPEGAVRETERAIKNGALGVQTYTNVNGKALDRPEFEPFFADHEQARQADLDPSERAAPTSRTISTRRNRSTRSGGRSAGPTRPPPPWRASCSPRRIDKSRPEAHHASLRRHRADARRPHRPGLGPARRAHLGCRLRRRSSALKKRPLDYFKENFYADTAVFGSDGGTVLGLMFYPHGQDRVRVRLPVRSREGHRLHPRDAAHPRQPQPVEGGPGEDLL